MVILSEILRILFSYSSNHSFLQPTSYLHNLAALTSTAFHSSFGGRILSMGWVMEESEVAEVI